MGFCRFVSTVGISDSKHSSSSSSSPPSPLLLLLLVLLLLNLFRLLHEILPLVRCHHQWVLHLDSELLLDLQAHCSAILMSRLLTLFLKTLLGISHTVGFFRLSLLGSGRNWEYQSRDKLE